MLHNLKSLKSKDSILPLGSVAVGFRFTPPHSPVSLAHAELTDGIGTSIGQSMSNTTGRLANLGIWWHPKSCYLMLFLHRMQTDAGYCWCCLSQLRLQSESYKILQVSGLICSMMINDDQCISMRCSFQPWNALNAHGLALTDRS